MEDETLRALQAIASAEVLNIAKPSREKPQPRTRVPVPELDPLVWNSYQTGTTKYLTPIPAASADETVRLLRRSRVYLAWSRDLDIRLDVLVLKPGDPKLTAEGIYDPPRGHVAVRFLARPPHNKGVRAQQAKLRGTS